MVARRFFGSGRFSGFGRKAIVSVAILAMATGTFVWRARYYLFGITPPALHVVSDDRPEPELLPPLRSGDDAVVFVDWYRNSLLIICDLPDVVVDADWRDQVEITGSGDVVILRSTPFELRGATRAGFAIVAANGHVERAWPLSNGGAAGAFKLLGSIQRKERARVLSELRRCERSKDLDEDVRRWIDGV